MSEKGKMPNNEDTSHKAEAWGKAIGDTVKKAKEAQDELARKTKEILDKALGGKKEEGKE
ncbi:MAG: hypothetical protein AB1352_04375 [Patescibacteria group bacterium]